MLQRLFLAFTLAFPLYLSIAIQQTSPLTDGVNRPSPPSIKKIEQTVKSISILSSLAGQAVRYLFFFCVFLLSFEFNQCKP
jgi:hypothetical protein